MSWRLPLGIMAGRGGATGYAVTPSNNLVEGIGDSITVASHNTAGAGITTQTLFQPRIQNTSGSTGGMLTWASILPATGQSYGDGRFRFVGTHATSGYTIAQMVTTHIDGADSPTASSPKPGIVVVHIGTNDLAAMLTANVLDPAKVATRKANLKTGLETLIAAGILPLVCKIVPSNTVLNQQSVTAWNVAIGELAIELNIPVADCFTPCATGNDWTANYHSGDGVHPSVTGAKAAGQAIRDALETVLPATLPALVTTSTDGTGLGNFYENGANQVVGGTAGVPKGGNPAANAYWTWTASGTTPTLAARSGFDGIAWTWTKASDAANTTASGSSSGNGVMTMIDGNTYEFGFVAEIESWIQDDMYLSISLQKVTDGSKRCDFVIRRDANFSSAIAPFKYFKTIKCNATTFPAGTYRLLITLGDDAATTNAFGTVHIGQLTVRDLGSI